MKKALFILSFIAVGFVSCDKSDDNTTDSQSKLVGKWKVTSHTYSATVNNQPIPDEDIDLGNINGTIFEFKANNQMSVTLLDEDTNQWVTTQGTYVYNPSENKITTTQTEPGTTNTYTEVMYIRDLNATVFNFRMTQEETEGTNVYKLVLDANCTKQ
ncbi:hypothetical protein QW060_23085 [Myroides ceti]|uniref:Lipocalin-like domain-containing protein n=1 Tax=Paenimyroides ceti TaxID=395087 RepID=A0ABT8CRS5_9FLAO|nr:hypothetical protein [Paenimyroides ceti]MDN3706302.1 hypothetical protein [Paenimyroides ceti]MDN3709823.1 hypothetical protein [Paenimyroides ceti]